MRATIAQQSPIFSLTQRCFNQRIQLYRETKIKIDRGASQLLTTIADSLSPARESRFVQASINMRVNRPSSPWLTWLAILQPENLSSERANPPILISTSPGSRRAVHEIPENE
jgi:hypothetical protein